MTDEPTTPAAEHEDFCWEGAARTGYPPERAGIAHRDANSAPVDPSATPTLEGAQIATDEPDWHRRHATLQELATNLRAQRDEARAERDQALLSASVRQDTINQLRRTIGTDQSMAHVAYKERVGLHASCQLLLNNLTDMENQRDEARTHLANVEAAIAPWPPGVRKGDVLRALGIEA